jgi:protein SCO1
MFRKVSFVFALFAFGAVSPALGQQSPEDADAVSRDYFTDTYLLTQDGEEVRFYSDVLKDQIVVINFIFTNCQGACPLITQKLRMAREQLGEETASKIRFISISIDPTRDTPAAMREFAKAQNADGNWVFLTGAQENIDLVVKKLGQYYPDVEEHSTLVIAGNVKTRLWMKIPPQAQAAGVAAKLRQLVDG